MGTVAKVLVSTSLVSVGSNVSEAATWNGSAGVLVINAQQFAPVVNLVLLSPSGAIAVNSTNLSANGVYPMPLPAGSYQMHSAGGSSIGLYAQLCSL